jgi:glycosyltransferase involved in cell wall biosynthesis
MDLSIVIPARNEEASIARQLDALLAQEWNGDWEVVVVDNGSRDSTGAIVEQLAATHPRLRLVREPTAGLCHARNAGIGAAQADAIAICDADDLVDEGWVSAMGDALRDQAFITGIHELELLNPPWLAASRGRNDTTSPPTFHGFFPYPNGNNFGLRREVFDAAGPFDQAFIGAEDVEFGLRASQAGYELHLLSGAVVHYAFRSSTRDLWKQGLGYGQPRPAVARALVEATGERPPRLAGWRSWLWLVVNSPRLVTRSGRSRMAWVAGNRLGHLRGSVTHQTLLL